MRQEISKLYIKGRGLEIGAFHNPWPTQAQVVYADKCDLQTLVRTSGWKGNINKCVRPDFITNAETLDNVPSDTYDFVLGSHILEHCISPLTAIENQIRVLKKGGYLIHVVPEKDHCFDKNRKSSTLNCVINDYENPDIDNMIKHYKDYFIHVDNCKDDENLLKLINQKIIDNIDVHFHAWDESSLKSFFEYAGGRFGFSTLLFQFLHHEVFVVCQKG